MKNILFHKKKTNKTEISINSKIFKKNSKFKKSKFHKSESEDSENLSNAYQNINALLSNCLETIRKDIRKDSIDNDNLNSTLLRNVTNKNKQISYNKINSKKKTTSRQKKSFILNKTNSLSNSNTVFIKNSEDNLLKSLNLDIEKNNLHRKKTTPSKIHKKRTNHSEIPIINNILEDKINNKFIKKNTLNTCNTKLKRNFKASKYLLFGKKKDEIEKEYSSFNIKELNKNFSIKNKNTKNSFKTNITLKGKSKKKVDFNGVNMNLISNIENFSPKSIKIKNKRSKKVTFKEPKIKRRKYKLNTLNNISEKYKNQLTIGKNNQAFLSTNSIISDRKNKSSKYLSKISYLQRPNTVTVPFKVKNSIDNYQKKNTLKSNRALKAPKQSLKILSLEQIGENMKQSLFHFNLTEAKKELYNLENNDISEAIKNLPTKKFGDNNDETLPSKKDNNNKINLNYSHEISSEKSENTNKKINKYQQKYRKLLLINKVYDSLDDEEIGDEEEIDNFYLSPNSFPVYFIDSLILISSFIELFYLPYFLAYKKIFCREILNIESILFYSIDFIYIIDFIAGFFRSYYNFEEILVKNNIYIVINYLKGRFLFDFIEAIPFYTFFSFNEEKCSLNKIHYLSNFELYNFRYSFLIIKILKIFKTFGENKAMNQVIDLLNKIDFFNNWNGVFFTIIIFASLINFFSCVFIYLGKIVQPGWIIAQNIQDKDFKYIYVTSIYYLMTTLTTVGFGDIKIMTIYERFYQIILLIVGTCAYSWILTFISNYIKKMNEQYIDFENKVKILGDIKISYPLLTNELYEKIIRFLKYNKSENKFNVDYILDSLPLSLKNNVIIDMYKPIIKNFHFFKSFQNSDFFVKIVTSLKPVLSVKNDILIQEGDVIEDIIFIKKGVLSLEICIDLDCPQESCEAHLNPNGLTTTIEPQQTIIGNISHSLVSSNFNYSRNHTHTKKQILKSNKKYMNIINLRKNEHYGDILMILNERSPLTVKVKSKKAELFFLEKTEATEISNKYPNIWKRIVQKSSYNMRQIKNLMKKKIIIFCDLNGIWINPDIKKHANVDISEGMNSFADSILFNNRSKTLLKNNSNKSRKNCLKNNKNNYNFNNKDKNQIDSIIYEVDENVESNINSFPSPKINNSTQSLGLRFSSKKDRNSGSNKFFSSNKVIKPFLNKSQNKESKEDIFHFNSDSNSSKIKTPFNNKEFSSDSLSNEEESKETDSNKSEKSNKTSKNEKVENNKNLNLINNKLNKVITVIKEKMKMKPNTSFVNNFNINFFNHKTYNIPINHINRRFSEPNIFYKYYKYSDEDNEINEELYSDEDFNIDVGKQNIFFINSDNNNNIFYPYINNYNNSKNIPNEFTLSRLLEKNKSKISLYRERTNTKLSKNSDLIKSSGFSNLFSETSISFSLNSTYENINKLTGYKISKDHFLQKKIKNYILDECFFQTNTTNNAKRNTFNINSPKVESKFKKARKFGSIQPRKIKNNKISTILGKNNSFLGKNNSFLGKNNSFLGMIKTDREEFKSKKITMRHSLKLRQKKRLYSIDNMSSVNKINQRRKSIEMDNSRFTKKRRGSVNFRQPNSTSFMKYSFISNRHNIAPSEDFLFNKKTTKRSALKLKDEEEMSFYTKIKTIRNNNNLSTSSFIAKPNKLNLMDQVTKNIQNNKQNLNNPEEYFSGFFSNILQRKKTIWKKSNKNNRKAANNNITNLKRTSTSSEIIRRNNDNSKFNI